jgi:hypothetical protein
MVYKKLVVYFHYYFDNNNYCLANGKLLT